MSPDEAPLPGDDELAEWERLAAAFARMAGAEIVTALGGGVDVRYKPGREGEAPDRDPVTDIDRSVETLIRMRLADRFPEHDIIGEELDERPGRDHDVVWAVDPVDGTANFVNGFPLFAASVGVLHRGRPVAGAVWCSTTHAVRAGVYHARDGGGLHLDGAPCNRQPNPGLRRRLAGLPGGAPSPAALEVRTTGSAALECAFAAAGLLAGTRFIRPNLWDVAGGTALALAAGRQVRVHDGKGWQDFDRFLPGAGPLGPADLQHWSRDMAIGDAGTVARLTGEG